MHLLLPLLAIFVTMTSALPPGSDPLRRAIEPRQGGNNNFVSSVEIFGLYNLDC